MKRPFRFFRGEFMGGLYLKSLLLCFNYLVADILDELVYHIKVQWKTEDEVAGDEIAMRDEDILNIGKTAGLFPFRALARTMLGSLYFTPSFIVKGKQRSERGLMNIENESFEFVRTAEDDYPDDIANEASPAKRMGLRDSKAVPVGYVREGTPLYTEGGDVIWENVLPAPPAGEACIPYYGEKYLVHEEHFTKVLPLPVVVYKPLLESCQRIRFNGATLQEFFNIAEILGEGYIHNLEIAPDASRRWYNVYYDLDEYVTILNRDRRYLAWLKVCAYKFKLFKLINRDPFYELGQGGSDVQSE
jgi:hypothetical protein